MADVYKNREKLAEIIKYLAIPEVVVLHGSRQVGKTTLLKMTMAYLARQEETAVVFYFDLEKEEHLELCSKGAEEIIEYIKAKTPSGSQSRSGQKIYVFIDEIQYLDNPSSLLKLFYDHYKDRFKLIVSGSSSFAIKSKFKNSLVGRAVDLEIFGLSFKEFLDFRGLSYDLAATSQTAIEELKKLYQEYALFGFYPQVVLAPSLELKEVYLRGILEKYVYRDIRDLANIKDIRKFNSLLRFLASQAGQLLNMNELANTSKIARQTLEEYLFILENTYIIKLIYPYHENIRSELTKMPKIYFEDAGLLNMLKNKRIINTLSGSMLENSLYAYLRRSYPVGEINFWRTTAGQEIDFILTAPKIIPMEVKMNYQDKLMKNLLYFGKNYGLDDLYCLTLHKQEKVKHKKIKQLYPWEMEILKNKT